MYAGTGEGFASNIFFQKFEVDIDAPNAADLEEARVLLIRHATTDFNVAHQQVVKDHGLEGDEWRHFRVKREFVDPPINDMGRAQCASGSEHVDKIDFKVVFVSPMLRTC